MGFKILLAGLLVLSLALFLGCAKQEHPAGQEHSMEKGAGHSEGKAEEGEHPEGEMKGMDHSEGKAEEGEHPEGEMKGMDHSEGKAEEGEHPEGEGHDHEAEHPEEEKKEMEHPEAKAAPKKPITIAELAKSIEGYVNDEVELKGGCFLVYDEVGGEPLVLQLKKIHKDKLAKIEDQVYFACADFETPEGKVYDLDVFMEGESKGDLKVTEITVHKESGKARYTWHEVDGIWKKKHKEGMKPKPKKAEHPMEHPE